jgi:DNA polymerase IV
VNRKIIHIDMDAFFASVEQRDNPSLRGKPVIVGGDARSRGVVCTCSYEARVFGVRSAMASRIAYRLCPRAIFVRPRFEAYVHASRQIREIFHEYTDLVEPLSLDEAYLDVTENKKNQPLAGVIAREIKNKIFEKTSLVASAGVSYNKFLAKSASDLNKPDGFAVITPERAASFIEGLPIGKFFGIGRATEKTMIELGIRTGADLMRADRGFLMKHFGKMGNYFFEISRGIDNRPVNPYRIRKSFGKEITLDEDTNDREEMMEIIKELAGMVSSLLLEHHRKGKTVTLKIKYHDFESISRSVTLTEAEDNRDLITDFAIRLLDETEAGKKKVRLLGVAVSNLDIEEPEYETGKQLVFHFDHILS